MQLNRATDIALRVLMLTAATDRKVTVEEAASALNVPRTHVAKVVQRLAALELLDTARGRSGGVRINPAAHTTPIGSIVRIFEGDDEVIDCEGLNCPLRQACRLRQALRTARDAFYASLDELTIGDLVKAPTSSLLLELTRM